MPFSLRNTKVPLTFKVPIDIPISRVADLLTSGLESGGYGSFVIVKYIEPTEITFKSWSSDKDLPFDTVTVFKHIDYPFNPGGAIILEAMDGGDVDKKGKQKRYRLDLKAIKRGLQLMAEKNPTQWGKFLSEDGGDAITGDCFVQYAACGEEIWR